EVVRTVTEGLKTLYKKKLLPVEEFYRFHDFHSPALEDADFDNKPMVLVVGQYSTGKTTFIRYLLEQEIPGSRIGPEPTTDSFVAIMHGETEGITPGNALIGQRGIICTLRMAAPPPQGPPTPGATQPSPGGIPQFPLFPPPLPGYDFPAVLQWFAERVDLIILLFDAHKLEISDEFSEAIRALKGNEDKIRVVLNKADMVETQQLMRVYGALMWSLGKVFNTPEVLRVFIGSFWSEPLLITDNRQLFELEEQDLFQDIQNLPRNAALRKLNDLVKRARLVRVSAADWVRGSSPRLRWGQGDTGTPWRSPHLWEEKEAPPCRGSGGMLTPLCRVRVSPPFQELLLVHDFARFPGLKPRMLEALDELLTTDIAALMPLLRQEELEAPEGAGVQGGAFDGTRQGPFSGAEEEEEGEEEEEWVVTKDKAKYDEIFYGLAPLGGKLSGRRARGWMVSSNLPSSVLGRIWQLSDVDRDGMLDAEEFALAGHLIGAKLEGRGLPADLPPRLVPPSKRRPKGSAE
ncbi:EH domain-containing protein 2, partial [Spheniscus magellanicus]